MADGVAAITEAVEEVFGEIANEKYVFWVNFNIIKMLDCAILLI